MRWSTSWIVIRIAQVELVTHLCLGNCLETTFFNGIVIQFPDLKH